MTETRNNQYIDKTAQKGDQLSYRVRAVAKDGRASNWSAPATITAGDNTKPDDPTNFRVSNGYAGCLLTWDFPGNDPTYSHTEIFRRTVATGEIVFFGNKVVGNITGTSYRLIGRPSAEEFFAPGDFNADYYFKIRHVDKAGNKSNFSDERRGRTRKLEPADVDQTPGKDQIFVRPKEGIPASEIIIRDTDTQGNIIYKNFQNWYEEKESEIEGLKQVDLQTNARIVNLGNSIQALQETVGNQLNNIQQQVDANNLIQRKSMVIQNLLAERKAEQAELIRLKEANNQLVDALKKAREHILNLEQG